MPRIILLCLLYLLPDFSIAQNPYNVLFPIRENDKWGFIDSTGSVVIKPQFLNAGDFSEGLAPVRVGGFYGYVNAKGKMPIKAKYHYAESFVDGLGKVWMDGKPFFVDRNGRLTYDNRFIEIDGFRDGSQRAIVVLRYSDTGFMPRGRKALIDRRGRLILDTLFSDIIRVNEDRYICTFDGSDSICKRTITWSGHTYERTFPATCVLDANGHTITPTGLFYMPKRQAFGHFSAQLIGDTTSNYWRFTEDGNLISEQIRYGVRVSWSEGLAPQNLITIPMAEWRQKGYPKDSIKAGWINQMGQFIEPDTVLDQMGESGSGFNNGRVFGRLNRPKTGYAESPYLLFGKDGRRVSNRVFKNFIPFQSSGRNRVCFWDGQAVVQSEEGLYEIIDTMGNTIFQFDKDYFRFGRWGGYIKPMGNFWVFTTVEGVEDVWNKKEHYSWNKLQYEYNYGADNQASLIRACDILGRVTYYDRAGKVIWQEKQIDLARNTPPKGFNTDHLLKDLFFVVKKVPEDHPDLARDSLFVLMLKKDATTFIPSYPYSSHRRDSVSRKAFKGYFVNNSLDTLFYRNPYFGLQALDKTGQWQDIMYHPGPFVCGSGSDWLQALAPKTMYEFTVPDFEGEMETEIRLVISASKGFYSNSVKTHLNPSQFWRKPIDSRSGVLKPYPDIKWQ